MTLKLNGSSSGYTAIDAPASAGSNTLVLPTTNGSAGQVLTTDGNGNLSWKTPGKLLNIVQNNITEKLSNSTASEAWWTPSELNTNITPATGSKVLIQGWINVGASAGMTIFIKLRRGSTDISIADAAGSRRRSTASGNCISVSGSQAVPFSFLDASPGGDGSTAITYTIYLSHPSGSTQTISINSDHADGDDADAARQSSNIILMEVAA